MTPMIYEAVISTCDADGGPHFTPMGYRISGDEIVLAPFVPSRTLDNLRREQHAVLNLTDDVSVIAGCLTGRRQWPTVAAERIGGYRLAQALAHRELHCVRCDDDPTRPVFYCETMFEQTHGPFMGFNRAQAAVVEAAILLSRLDWLDPDKVSLEMSYLRTSIEKTAGARELEAWRWITEAIRGHARHDISEALDV